MKGTPLFLGWLALAALLFCCANAGAVDIDRGQISQLIKALDDENERYGAAVALAGLGKPAVPALRQLLVSNRSDRRLWSAYTLGEIGPAAQPAVADLMKLLRDPDPACRAESARTLGKIGPASAASVCQLATLLADEHLQVRRRAVAALGRLGPASAPASSQLIAALKDHHLRPFATAALVRIGGPAVPVLRESLGDDELRFDVSLILSKVDALSAGLGEPTLADLRSLRIVLFDLTRTPPERTRAANALASLGPAGMVVLISAFTEPSLADAAASAFAQAGPDGAALLIGALAHHQPAVRAAAADALRQIGPAAQMAIPHLVRLFKDSDHGVRYRAVLALDAFGKNAAPAVPGLIELMLDSNQREPARQWAIMTLVNTLPDTHDQVVEALIRASQDEGNYGVRSLAKSQVRLIDPQAAEAAGLR